MLIDWFTVGAQAVNFFILVWLLKRFLYKPVINAIDAREKRIARELAGADAKAAEARKERDEFQLKNEDFDRQRATLLSEAVEEAHAERQRLFDEARHAAEELRVTRQKTLQNEASSLREAVSLRTRQEVFAITRKTLTDLASISLEEQMVVVFIRRLNEMDKQVKTENQNAFIQGEVQIMVATSAFVVALFRFSAMVLSSSLRFSSFSSFSSFVLAFLSSLVFFLESLSVPKTLNPPPSPRLDTPEEIKSLTDIRVLGTTGPLKPRFLASNFVCFWPFLYKSTAPPGRAVAP